MDMLHYIKWRGDLSFDERELNEIDSLIFATLSYEEFDGILDKDTKLSLTQTAKLFFSNHKEDDLKNRKSFTCRSYELLKVMATSLRYKNLILSHYVNEMDETQNLQFSAITFEYKNKWKYIAFRGTDDTIVGWKEDFTMLYKDEILSQRKAVQYTNEIFKQQKPFSTMKYYIGGHSKGGNLAIYASAFAPNHIKKRILRIDNFDGPGFDIKFWRNQNLTSLLPKITTYIPTASFFGRLFKYKGKIVIIKSEQRGLLQHIPFNWHINVIQFVYEDEVSEGSDKAINKFNELMNDYTKKEREQLVEALFSIFKKLEIYTIEDLTKISATRVINSLKELNELDAQTRKVVREVLSMIWDITDI